MMSTGSPATVFRDTGLSARSVSALWRGSRNAALAWLSVYLAASGVILAAAHSWLALGHAAAIAVATWSCRDRGPVSRTIGDLLPLLVAPILYGEVPLLIGTLGSSFHDVRVQGWELAVFGRHPSR